MILTQNIHMKEIFFENIEAKIIISNTVSNSIFAPSQCETCNCFKDFSNDTKAIYKYNCFIKEGDVYCDIAKVRLEALIKSENSRDLEDYINKLKERKSENRKNI
jgi:hypothetical protein